MESPISIGTTEIVVDRFKSRFPASAAVLSAVDTLYSDAVYLDGVSDKFWDFALKILSNYADWLTTCVRFASICVAKQF